MSAVLSATPSYVVRRKKWTRDQLHEKEHVLVTQYGELKDLQSRADTYGLTDAEFAALSELRRIRFLLGPSEVSVS